MTDERKHAHHAQVGDLHLETWEAYHRYFWSVTNTKTHEQLSSGEADNLDAAKLAASSTAGVQGQELKWRGIGPPL